MTQKKAGRGWRREEEDRKEGAKGLKREKGNETGSCSAARPTTQPVQKKGRGRGRGQLAAKGNALATALVYPHTFAEKYFAAKKLTNSTDYIKKYLPIQPEFIFGKNRFSDDPLGTEHTAQPAGSSQPARRSSSPPSPLRQCVSASRLDLPSSPPLRPWLLRPWTAKKPFGSSLPFLPSPAPAQRCARQHLCMPAEVHGAGFNKSPVT